jgi:hypothetical protein
MRHVLEERAVTPPATVAAHMSIGMLRALGLPAIRAQLLASRAAQGYSACRFYQIRLIMTNFKWRSAQGPSSLLSGAVAPDALLDHA